MSCDELECHWCFEEINKAQQMSNVVEWGPWVACDYCMETMCEICDGPCTDICENCSRVCHAYPCDNISSKCIGYCSRCSCYPKDDIEMDTCTVCDIKLTVDEQEGYNTKNGNVVDGKAFCDKCVTINEIQEVSECQED